MNHVDRLIQSFCVLGFLSSRPGLRGEEWASMLAMNEQNGSCSAFWTMKGLCFMTGYNKVIQSLLHVHCLISIYQTNSITHHERYTAHFPHESYAELFLHYFLYVCPFHCKGEEAHSQVQCNLWSKNCTQITSEQLSMMVGNMTGELWGAHF